MFQQSMMSRMTESISHGQSALCQIKLGISWQSVGINRFLQFLSCAIFRALKATFVSARIGEAAGSLPNHCSVRHV